MGDFVEPELQDGAGLWNADGVSNAGSFASAVAVLARPGDAARGARLIMMGISWMELMVIVMIALIVIGPKDLPAALRTLGQGLRAVRRMAREFQVQFDQFVRESEIDALRRDVEDAAQDRATMRASPRVAGETATAPRPSPAPERVPASAETAASKNGTPIEAD